MCYVSLRLEPLSLSRYFRVCIQVVCVGVYAFMSVGTSVCNRTSSTWFSAYVSTFECSVCVL